MLLGAFLVLCVSSFPRLPKLGVFDIIERWLDNEVGCIS